MEYKNNLNIIFHNEEDNEYKTNLVAVDVNEIEHQLFERDYDGNVMNDIDMEQIKMTNKNFEAAKQKVSSESDVISSSVQQKKSPFQQNSIAINGQFTGLHTIPEGKFGEQQEEDNEKKRQRDHSIFHDHDSSEPKKQFHDKDDDLNDNDNNNNNNITFPIVKLIDPNNSLLSFISELSSEMNFTFDEMVNQETGFPIPRIQGLMTKVMTRIRSHTSLKNVKLSNLIYDDGDDCEVRKYFLMLISLTENANSGGSAYPKYINSNGTGMRFIISTNKFRMENAKHDVKYVYKIFERLYWRSNPQIMELEKKIKIITDSLKVLKTNGISVVKVKKEKVATRIGGHIDPQILTANLKEQLTMTVIQLTELQLQMPQVLRIGSRIKRYF